MASKVTPVRLNYKGEPEGELVPVLDQLESITVRLRRLGRYATATTGVSLVLILIHGAFASLLNGASSRAITLAGIVLPLFSIAYVIWFDSAKKKGDAVFKELSDELQWYVRYGSNEKSTKAEPNASIRPDIRTRIVLREYASSTALPLLSSGANGPAIYAAANAFLSLCSLMLSVFLRMHG